MDSQKKNQHGLAMSLKLTVSDKRIYIYTCTCRPLFSESFIMPLFLKIARHSAESCPMHNEKVKKATVDLMGKLGQLTKKHGIKVVGGWTSIPDHLVVAVYDAPSMEAMLKFSMEPEVMDWLGYHMSEIKPVMTLEESMKLLK
jgi:hypothetical protein